VCACGHRTLPQNPRPADPARVSPNAGLRSCYGAASTACLEK
jgi:hypothetical protein